MVRRSGKPRSSNYGDGLGSSNRLNRSSRGLSTGKSSVDPLSAEAISRMAAGNVAKKLHLTAAFHRGELELDKEFQQTVESVKQIRQSAEEDRIKKIEAERQEAERLEKVDEADMEQAIEDANAEREAQWQMEQEQEELINSGIVSEDDEEDDEDTEDSKEPVEGYNRRVGDILLGAYDGMFTLYADSSGGGGTADRISITGGIVLRKNRYDLVAADTITLATQDTYTIYAECIPGAVPTFKSTTDPATDLPDSSAWHIPLGTATRDSNDVYTVDSQDWDGGPICIGGGVPDGTADYDILYWDNTAKEWKLLPFATSNYQVLQRKSDGTLGWDWLRWA